MKSFWGLIPRSLFKNKRRAFFIAIGIILSCALIISLSIMLDALKKKSYQSMIDDAGGIYDISFTTVDKESLDKLLADPIVNKASVSVNLGTSSIANSDYSLEINGYESSIPEFINFKLLSGKYPEKDDEIAIEEWLLPYMPEKYKIGDKVNLTSIIEYKNSKGKIEKIKRECSFTLVGIFEYKYNTMGLKSKATAYITRSYAESALSEELVKYSGYINVHNSSSIDKALEALSYSSEYEKVSFLSNYIKSFTLNGFKVLDFVSLMLHIIISIVASIIIYNIFSVSVVERTKEFGMLRAIGTSSTELKLLVLGEGVCLGAIFIPIGMILGNIIVKVIIAMISGYKDFTSLISIPKSGIINCLVVVFLTIISGTFFPARRAGRVSPIEAINSNNNLQLKGKKVKNSMQITNSVYKRLGSIFYMAYLNIRRNRKRFLTTVVSLSVSIIIFFSVRYLINSSDPLKNLKQSMGGDFLITATNSQESYSISDRDIDYIKSVEGISKITKQKKLQTAMEIQEGKITSEGMNGLKRESLKSPEARYDFEQKIYIFNVIISAYEIEELKKIGDKLAFGKIDENEFYEKPFVILGQNLNYSNNTKLQIGDSIKLRYPYYDENGKYINDKTESFIIGGLLKEDYLSDDASVNNVVIMSSKTAERFLQLKGYQKVTINIHKTSDYDKVFNGLKDKFESYRNIILKSYEEELEKVKQRNLQQSFIMYSFVFVVVIICIVNLINIMSMNVILRNREIGMLRALGFGNDEVKQMIIGEGLFYGLASSFFGTAIGIILTYLLFLISRKVLTQGMTWNFPIVTILVVFIVSNAVCILASANASKKLFTASIVESIRAIE